ncbi:MAG: hypothetical protein HWN67_08395 [Candidatus Helarchaeota archaeon]|nr:hypothetical protein [Candidatus Helarchaeota archaeon]
MSLDDTADVWRLRNTIKEKDKTISDLKLKLLEIQKKYATDIQNLIREKMELNVELKSMKPELEKKEEFIKQYSTSSLEKVKELQDKLAKVEKDWEMKYSIVDNRCKDLEKKYLDESEIKSREIARLNKNNSELKQKLEQEKTKTQKLTKLEEKIRELERERSLTIKDPKIAKKLSEFEDNLKNKDNEIYKLKEKLNDASLKIKKLSETSDYVPDLSIKELQIKIEDLKSQINSLNKELAFYEGKKIETIYFGERQAIECIKDIIKNTKRNLLLFIPKFTHLEQLDLTSLPPRIMIQAATSIDMGDRNQILNLDRYKDYGHIKLRKYPPADLYAIISDGDTLFFGFIDEKNVPVGFKSTKQNLISFLAGLLKDTFFRFTEEFKI